MTKTCSICSEEKSVNDFYASSGNHCKPCHYVRSRAWHLANPGKSAEASRKWRSKPENREKERQAWRAPRKREDRRAGWLKGKYGMTVADFDKMAAAQNYCCFLCGDDEMDEFHVDHNHDTGKVRGLLCSNCNTGIGLLRECPKLFERAAQYVAGERLTGAVAWRN